jgi:hypothetical protein
MCPSSKRRILVRVDEDLPEHKIDHRSDAGHVDTTRLARPGRKNAEDFDRQHAVFAKALDRIAHPLEMIERPARLQGAVRSHLGAHIVIDGFGGARDGPARLGPIFLFASGAVAGSRRLHGVVPDAVDAVAIHELANQVHPILVAISAVETRVVQAAFAREGRTLGVDREPLRLPAKTFRVDSPEIDAGDDANALPMAGCDQFTEDIAIPRQIRAGIGHRMIMAKEVHDAATIEHDGVGVDGAKMREDCRDVDLPHIGFTPERLDDAWGRMKPGSRDRAGGCANACQQGEEASLPTRHEAENNGGHRACDS